MGDTCDICGDPIPEEYSKFDPEAPVYGPEKGDVCHLKCEDERYDEVYCEI